MLAETERFIEKEGMLYAEIDVGRLRADRMKFTSFKDCKDIYLKDEIPETVTIDDIKIKADGSTRKVNKLPFVPSDKTERQQRCREIFELQVAALKRRMETAGNKLVVGVSGGLDSTLALLVSAMAVK